jgi:homoserine O-acetyltransferase
VKTARQLLGDRVVFLYRLAALAVLGTFPCLAQGTPSPVTAPTYPHQVEGDVHLKNFKFQDGETLPDLTIHYTTIGELRKNAAGQAQNAVMILHGTGGQGMVRPNVSELLFKPGQVLDAAKYFIILPDGIGHGKSSKPSDGLHAKFPHYTYEDMVEAQYQMLQQIGVNHLRLVMGMSMGGMHSWLWAEEHADFIDAAMPLASLPHQISGRNRMQRRMVIDAIKNDPDWNNGDYTKQPRGLIGALNIEFIMSSAPLQLQKKAPTLQAADDYYEQWIARVASDSDANDTLYQWDSSRTYDPEPNLDKITKPLYAINSADDEINPPELGIIDADIKKVKHGKFILIPLSDKTYGHGTHSHPELWSNYLAELLKVSQK